MDEKESSAPKRGRYGMVILPGAIQTAPGFAVVAPDGTIIGRYATAREATSEADRLNHNS